MSIKLSWLIPNVRVFCVLYVMYFVQQAMSWQAHESLPFFYNGNITEPDRQEESTSTSAKRDIEGEHISPDVVNQDRSIAKLNISIDSKDIPTSSSTGKTLERTYKRFKPDKLTV